MKSTKAASRYALSLLELALEQKSLDAVKSDMILLSQTVAENRELEIMLQSPIIKTGLKQKTLEKIFSSSVSKLTMAFISLLASKGREAILPQISTAFIELYNDHQGIVSAQVVTASALTSAQREELKKSLASTGKTIELVEKVDAKVLGGLRIKVGDQLIDATTRKKLNDLKIDISNHKLSAI